MNCGHYCKKGLMALGVVLFCLLYFYLGQWTDNELPQPQPTQNTQVSEKETDWQENINTMTGMIEQPFFGDLDELNQRHIIRVLVTTNRTNFFPTKHGFRGLEYDLMTAYEKYLNRKVKYGRFKTHLVFIPVTFEETLSKLEAGYGDIVASGVTITPERARLVDFTNPYITNVNEVLVAHKSAAKIERLEDLSAKQIVVVNNSSFIIHLEDINQELGRLGLPGIEIVKANPLFESEDLLNLVNQGLYDYTVADDHVAQIWLQVMENLVIQEDYKIRENTQIAWATQKNKPQLQASLNAFIRSYAKPGKKLGNAVFNKYFEDTYWIKMPLTNEMLSKVPCLKTYLQLYSDFFGFDWRLIAAQAYQESHFDQGKKSSAGARGIMQVKRSTAKDKNVDIANIHLLENNIHAGVKYLAFLRERYFSSEEYSEEDSTNFALAAYNAGPTKILKMQNKARAKGLNPYRWYNNVESMVRKSIGQETVNYVINIQKMRQYLIASDSIVLSKTKVLKQMQESQNEVVQSPETVLPPEAEDPPEIDLDLEMKDENALEDPTSETMQDGASFQNKETNLEATDNNQSALGQAVTQ